MNEVVGGRLCHRRPDCRLCGSSNLQSVLELTPTPPANAFVSESKLAQPQPTFHLEVFLCETCGHAQLLDVVDPEYLFRDYVYVSGTSPKFVQHFEQYAASVGAISAAQSGSLVVDIGSNDGTLLSAFKSLGFRVLGIDPALEIARNATNKGILTLPEFFDQNLANTIVTSHGQAAIITANNVFAHCDDLSGILDGVSTLLAADGVFVIEVSYLLDVIEKTLFDTIYHEHLSYHAIAPLQKFFKSHGLTLIDVERISSHGGSIRCVAAHSGSKLAATVSPHVEALIQQEHDAGILSPAAFVQLRDRIDTVRSSLFLQLLNLSAEGYKIAGFGAPAKATTMMYHFGIDRKLVEYIIDDSPLKQGLYSPGLHIPVVARSTLDTDARPDILLVLAWNFADSIVENNWGFVEQGGKFLIPLPEIKVIQS